MKKIFAIIASLVLLLMVSTGCNNRTQQAKNPPIESPAGNPFQSADNAMGILGSISHGPFEQDFDEIKNRNPFIFDGDEVALKYFINASGMAKNVGFLVFVNGVSQPYKIDDTNAPYEYVHIFNLKEDNADLPFMFIFSPVTGKKGDILDMNVVSIYNPAFMPDMDNLHYPL